MGVLYMTQSIQKKKKTNYLSYIIKLDYQIKI